MTESSARLTMTAVLESWPMRAPFRITGYNFTALDALVIRLGDGVHEGCGEAAGVYYKQDMPKQMLTQVEAVRTQIESGITRAELQELLPAGGARNALDCALWDLDAKRAGRPVWALAGLTKPRPLMTTYTVSADTPDAMAVRATSFTPARAIKLKLIGDDLDGARVAAVRRARPDVWLAVDANQGFTPHSLARLIPSLLEAGVRLIEQPFPMDRDDLLEGLACPIPIAADESVQTREDVVRLADKVSVINIKLDKSGGLTEALAMAQEVKRRGMRLMVGNMFGTALAMAPSFVVGQLCDVVDLDGPMSLKQDREPPVVYENGNVWCGPEIWGSPVTEDALK